MVEIGGLPTLVGGAVEDAKVIVVMLHGHSMHPADLAPFADSLNVPAAFYFPQGPRRVRSGGRSWWGVDGRRVARARARGPRDLARQHPKGRSAARERLAAFLDVLETTRGERPLLLGGFSQGGMLVCDFVLHSALRVDAIALLSSSRIAFDEWQPRLDRVRDLPILVTHGTRDPDLAFEAGQALQHALGAAGAKVQWLPFEGGHEIPLPAWRALRGFVKRLVPAPA